MQKKRPSWSCQDGRSTKRLSSSGVATRLTPGAHDPRLGPLALRPTLSSGLPLSLFFVCDPIGLYINVSRFGHPVYPSDGAHPKGGASRLEAVKTIWKGRGSRLWLVDSTLDLPDLPGSTPLSLMLPIHQGFDPISVAFSKAGPHTLTRPPRTA